MGLNIKVTYFVSIMLQSHGDETSDRDDDMRDCESSDEGVNVNSHINDNNSGMDYPRSPPHINPETHLK